MQDAVPVNRASLPYKVPFRQCIFNQTGPISATTGLNVHRFRHKQFRNTTFVLRLLLLYYYFYIFRTVRYRKLYQRSASTGLVRLVNNSSPDPTHLVRPGVPISTVDTKKIPQLTLFKYSKSKLGPFHCTLPHSRRFNRAERYRTVPLKVKKK